MVPLVSSRSPARPAPTERPPPGAPARRCDLVMDRDTKSECG
jgi:hypothetical protein